MGAEDVSFERDVDIPVGDAKVTLNIDQIKLIGVQPGYAAPELTARTLDETPFKLSELRGKVVLVDFWATWCAPCIAEIPNIRRLHEKYGADGKFVVVSISLNKSVAAVTKFRKKTSMPWTHIVTEGEFKSELAKAYGVKGVPAIFLIGPDGKLIAKNVSDSKLRKAVRKAMEQLGAEARAPTD